MTQKEIKIGTRASPLALYQANYIKDELLKKNDIKITLCKIKTTGDKILDVALAKVGGKGLFVKEIEEALLKGDIDLAVHSMKDVPVEFPDGLGITAVAARGDHRDALISRDNLKFEDLPQGATIGTSSLRRRAQLLNVRPDFNVVDIRGNVNTRLNKIKTENLDGVILAAAGMERLGMGDRITEYIPVKLSLPAIGQGVMGVECRLDDTYINSLLAAINDQNTFYIVSAERALLKKLEGGCQVPIGGYAQMQGEDEIILNGFVGSVDGSRCIHDVIQGPLTDAEKLGTRLGERMLENGAAEILKEVYCTDG